MSETRSPAPRAPLRLTLVLVFGGLLAACGPPSGKEGFEAFAAKDFKTAVEVLESTAKEGNTDAQYRLGMMYFFGQGVDKDQEQAVAWFGTCRSLGHAGCADAYAKSHTPMTPARKKTVSALTSQMITLVNGNIEARKKRNRIFGTVFFGPLLLWLGYLIFSRIVADAHTAHCERVAQHCKDTGKIHEFLLNNRGKSSEFYEDYSRAFFKLGEYQDALLLLDMKPTPGPGDEELREAITKALARLSSGKQAKPLVSEEGILAAVENEERCLAVALFFHKAGKTGEFLERHALKRDPRFYHAYAAAFHRLHEDGLALTLLERKRPLETGDYKVYVSTLLALEKTDRLSSEKVPEAHKLAFAEALMYAGKEPEALDVILKKRANPLTETDYAAALRLCRRLERFDIASRLFSEIKDLIPVKEAPALYYYFALICEARGQVTLAGKIYGSLTEDHPDFKDAAARISRLKSIPPRETARLETFTKHSTTPAPGAERREKPRFEVVAGKFEVRQPLGIGSMGVVYKGWDKVLSREVAIKRPLDNIASDKLARKRFVEQSRRAAKLNHPNIVSVHGIVDTHDDLCLISEYMDGETIESLLANRGKLHAEECVRIFMFVGAALAFAYRNGVDHLNLKPSNIMMSKRGYIKVMDFGIAGTQAYMSPEQHDGRASPLSDVYSFGVTAYEMLSGRLPFKGTDLYSLKKAESWKPLPKGTPPELEELIGQCMKFDPAGRPLGMVPLMSGLIDIF